MTIARPTPLSLARPTAELPQPAAAALSRLESAFPAVLAEQHRVERAAAGLHNGESAVINGTPVTAVSLAEAEAELAARRETAAKVNAALGFRASWKPRVHLGETATHRVVWSQMELNEIFERVGDVVSLREVERSTSDGSATWTAAEITLTVDVPDVGPVTVATDIEDDPEHGYRTDIPVVKVARAITRYEAASERTAAISKALADPEYKPTGLEWDDLAHAREVMTGSRDILAEAGKLKLIGGA